MKYLATASLVCLVLIQTGAAQRPEDALVVAAEMFFKDGRAVERGPVTLDAQLTATKGGTLLLSCSDNTRLYSCGQATCRLTACAEAGDGITRLDWGFAATRSFDGQSPLSAPRNESRGWLASIMTALFTREPKMPITAAARGVGDPVDAVLLQDERGVHWAPALKGVLAERYCLRLNPLPATGSALFSTPTLQWDRRADPEAVAAIPNLKSGLYSLEKGSSVNGGCQADADGEPAWVLVVSARDFAGLNAEWTEQQAKVAELEREGVSPVVVSSLRHAALAWLAEPSSGRQGPP